MGILGYGYKAYKALKTGKTITGVKPLKKISGSKTVEQHKKKISDIKDRKKYSDELEAAGAKLIDTVNQTGKSLNQLNETLKKQKKILDD